MFMSTTLAHYQLSLFRVTPTVLETEIGADQRSIFMRPITAGAASTELPPSQTVPAAEKKVPPLELKEWLQSLQAYEAEATRPAPEAEDTGSSATAETVPGALPDADDPPAVIADPAPPAADPEPEAPAPVATAPEPADPPPSGAEPGAGSGSSGGGLGGLLNGLLK